MPISLNELQTWWQATAGDYFRRHDSPARISGKFRYHEDDAYLDLLEIKGINIETIKNILPRDPPIVSSGKPNGSQFSRTDDDSPTQEGESSTGCWWNAWASVFTSISLCSPIIDPVRLADLFQEKRRVRFFCDTNALSGGVVEWLLLHLGRGVDLVTSAVVDREIAAWPQKNIFRTKTVCRWKLRTHYRLARRLLAVPPAGTVIDRLSPEQSALMLAKYRDENIGKSPDADVLLVELARRLVRDQPRNARVLFLTGDRTNAYTAAAVLGPENVLYAAADSGVAKRSVSTVVTRGSWFPIGPLGSVQTQQCAMFFWSLLAACDDVKVTFGTDEWAILPCHSIRNGAPSDWYAPHVDVRRLTSKSLPRPPAVATPKKESKVPSGPSDSKTQDDGVYQPKTFSEQPRKRSWLLPPVPLPEVLDDVAASWRPSPRIFFQYLAYLFDSTLKKPPNNAVQREVRKIFNALDVVDSSGAAGPRLGEFREAWLESRYDWYHAQMQSIPSYKHVMNQIASGAGDKLGQRERAHAGLARCLGQAARLRRGDPLLLGDRPVSAEVLLEWLESLLPEENATLSTADACAHAASALGLTPFRFESAMVSLWDTGKGKHLEGRTGGTVTSGTTESIVVMGTIGPVQYRTVGAGDLRFGRTGTVRFITRVQ